MKTADLNAGHLYQEITIDGPDWIITGRLRRVAHGADEITEQSISAPYPTTVPGERWVDITVGPFDFRARGDENVQINEPT